MARGKRPATFRTRKLSLSAPMVLPWRRGGRVGRRRTTIPNGGQSYVLWPPFALCPENAVAESGESAVDQKRYPEVMTSPRRGSGGARDDRSPGSGRNSAGSGGAGHPRGGSAGAGGTRRPRPQEESERERPAGPRGFKPGGGDRRSGGGARPTSGGAARGSGSRDGAASRDEKGSWQGRRPAAGRPT